MAVADYVTRIEFEGFQRSLVEELRLAAESREQILENQQAMIETLGGIDRRLSGIEGKLDRFNGQH